jgi:hypothetical protein
MSRLGRVTGVLTIAILGVLSLVAPAYAGGSFQDCIDKAVDHNGEAPTCTKVNGQWVASWPDDQASAGIGGGFVFLVVIGLLAAVAITIWKVTTAQKLARQSGMDPGLATQMTLLSDDGLDATYLASSLRQPPADRPAPPAPVAPPAASARLEELKNLLDRGLITQDEYAERRKAIIDSV